MEDRYGEAYGAVNVYGCCSEAGQGAPSSEKRVGASTGMQTLDALRLRVWNQHRTRFIVIHNENVVKG